MMNCRIEKQCPSNVIEYLLLSNNQIFDAIDVFDLNKKICCDAFAKKAKNDEKGIIQKVISFIVLKLFSFSYSVFHCFMNNQNI